MAPARQEAPDKPGAFTGLELFAGAGGLALGGRMAGIAHKAALEWNPDACATLRANQERSRSPLATWPVLEEDASLFDFSSLGEVDIVSGGPPCQPFSVAGKRMGHMDSRDMFPVAARAVRELAPKAFIFENVKGLARATFSLYLEYVLGRLSLPEIVAKSGESWKEHLHRLRKAAASDTSSLRYDVSLKLANAADYGVPQKRERLFIVGIRHDLGARWSFPKPTHSLDALLHSQWIDSSYWERHGVKAPQSPKNKTRLEERLRTFAPDLLPKPWLTVRDAISDLPEPGDSAQDAPLANHVRQPGARGYPGHTGSSFDMPAKTLKAGAHGVPGGENMLVLPNGAARYFTAREAARLQCFPDDWVFTGSWSEAMRQIGNAVPVELARVAIGSVIMSLRQAESC